MTPDAPDFVVTAAASSLEVALTYLKLGIEHILLGIDHLLFVLTLLILVQGTKTLTVTITAFTVAYSITLAGASLGFLDVPGAPVVACIALAKGCRSACPTGPGASRHMRSGASPRSGGSSAWRHSGRDRDIGPRARGEGMAPHCVWRENDATAAAGARP